MKLRRISFFWCFCFPLFSILAAGAHADSDEDGTCSSPSDEKECTTSVNKQGVRIITREELESKIGVDAGSEIWLSFLGKY